MDKKQSPRYDDLKHIDSTAIKKKKKKIED